MQQGDVLMKKWCFGTGRAKAREEAVQGANGEVKTYVTYHGIVTGKHYFNLF